MQVREASNREVLEAEWIRNILVHTAIWTAKESGSRWILSLRRAIETSLLETASFEAPAHPPCGTMLFFITRKKLLTGLLDFYRNCSCDFDSGTVGGDGSTTAFS